MLMNADILRQTFEMGLGYDEFVASGEPMHQPQWHQRYEQLVWTTPSGSWRRDSSDPSRSCADRYVVRRLRPAGASLHRIAEAAEGRIDLRFVLRSEQFAELVVANQINQGYRVPVTWFMAEDFQPCSRIGDRPPAGTVRWPARPWATHPVLAEPPADPVRTVLQEMLDEFEQVDLMLRLSPRLRELHGD